jgi:hypothetical protein
VRGETVEFADRCITDGKSLKNRPERAGLSVGTYCAQDTSGIVYQNNIFPANDGRQAKLPFRTLSFIRCFYLTQRRVYTGFPGGGAACGCLTYERFSAGENPAWFNWPSSS